MGSTFVAIRRPKLDERWWAAAAVLVAEAGGAEGGEEGWANAFLGGVAFGGVTS